MIISHKFKFIFIKTTKTAGTSTEIALSRHLGPDDIITPISDPDQKTRESLGYPGPQNYLASPSDYDGRDIARLLFQWRIKKRYYNHIPARLIKERIGEKIWNSYYKFCITRNPWDRVISKYYWNYPEEPRPTIAEMIAAETPLLGLKSRGYGLYTIDGKVVVDKICRFENLSEELEEVRQHLGIPDPLELPRAKAGTRKDRRSYRDILGPEERDKVAEIFREEIDLFDYRF